MLEHPSYMSRCNDWYQDNATNLVSGKNSGRNVTKLTKVTTRMPTCKRVGEYHWKETAKSLPAKVRGL